jgi:hypothetical protein
MWQGQRPLFRQRLFAIPLETVAARALGANLDVFQRLALAQAAKTISVAPHVAFYFRGIGPRILTQRPTDSFSQEKFLRVKGRLDARIQKIEIGILLESKLANNRRAPLPYIFRLAPREHFLAHWRRIIAQDRSDAVRRDGVYIIPPRACDDDFLVQRHRGWSLKRSRAFVPCQRNCCVTFFSMCGIPPKLEHACAPQFAGGEIEINEYSFAGLPQEGSIHAVIRHGGFHVRLHHRSLARVGYAPQFTSYLLQQRLHGPFIQLLPSLLQQLPHGPFIQKLPSGTVFGV